MARGFYTTYGVGTTDVIKSLYQTAPNPNGFTLAVWFFINGTGNNSFPHLFGTEFNFGINWQISLNNSNTQMQMQPNFTTTSGNWNWTVPQKGWHHLMMAYNPSSVSNNPIVYIDGVLTTVTTVTSPVGTFISSTQAISIGNSYSGSLFCWDGMIAHVAYYNGTLLTAADAALLGAGVNPLLVRPGSLSLYMPLDGASNPEPDLINGPTSALTGMALGKSDPPVAPLGRIRRFLDYEAGVIAAATAPHRAHGFGG